MNDLEILVDNEKVLVERFLEYGNEEKYFAIVGKDLYYHQSNGEYKVLRRNFMEDVK